MASAPSASAIRALALEYKGLSEDPVEGFRVKLVNEEDMFVWEVALFGPPDTLYQGGYFKVIFWKILMKLALLATAAAVHSSFLQFVLRLWWVSTRTVRTLCITGQ